MAKKIELIFKNELGRNVTLSLDNPIEPVDPAQINVVMDQVITEGAFISSGGSLVSKHAARVVERNVADIEIQAEKPTDQYPSQILEDFHITVSTQSQVKILSRLGDDTQNLTVSQREKQLFLPFLSTSKTLSSFIADFLTRGTEKQYSFAE